jgi:outer membrane protein assembly factor BamA
MQNAKNRWLRSAAVLHLAFCISHYTAQAHAQVGEPIAEILVEQEGQVVDDPTLTALIETRLGAPLQVSEVRETIAHFMSLNRFDDVQVFADKTDAGLRLRYSLRPLHPVDRIEFDGMLRLPEDSLRRIVVDRFSSSPRAGRRRISDAFVPMPAAWLRQRPRHLAC